MLETRWMLCFLTLLALVSCRREAPGDTASRVVDPTPAITAARATLEAGDAPAAARAAWALVQAHPERLDARLVLAAADVLQGRYAEALQSADAALRLDPENADAHTNRGAALHGLGRFDEALVATEAALERQQDHQGALRNAARIHGEAGRWLAEKVALEQLARLRPADAEVRLLLARNRVSAKDESAAAAAIAEALDRAPDNPALHVFAATIAYERDRLEVAMDHANIALRLQPERPDAHLIFEAAFYVRVASTLRCTAGAPPWPDEVVTGVLKGFQRQGVNGADRFRVLHARQGEDPDVVARVRRVGACD